VLCCAIVRLRIDCARATGRALPKESNEDCYEVDGRRIGAICHVHSVCRSGQIRLAVAKKLRMLGNDLAAVFVAGATRTQYRNTTKCRCSPDATAPRRLTSSVPPLRAMEKLPALVGGAVTDLEINPTILRK
jgi:hypothetical protein